MIEKMELFTAPTISKFPLPLHPHRFYPTTIRFQPFLRRTTYFPSLLNQTVFSFGLLYHRNSSLRSTTSEEISTDSTVYTKDEPKAIGDTQFVENKEDCESQLNKELQEDYEETYSFLAFGSGGAVALWVVAAIVGAIDSIPVLPKALELVGLGYALWFSSRYLILKKNREELFARVEQLKQQVLGSKDD